MSRSEQIFLLVLLLNTIISIIYLLWGILAHKKDEYGGNRRIVYIIRAVCMLVCPVIGILFFITSAVIKVIFFNKTVDLDDVIFSKDRVRQITKADEERDKNIVPIQDALAVSDTAKLRRLMMDVLKGDIDRSLSSIALALDSEDSETSHYAASVLSKSLNEFRINVRKLERQLDEDDENREECARMMIVYMDQVLMQKVFTAVEQDYFVKIMQNVCQRLYELQLSKKDEKQDDAYNYYAAMAKRLMETEDYKNARIWCERSLKMYPRDVSSYSCKLQYLYSTDNKEEFLKVLEELKTSGITIDSETLELIRIFR